MSKLTEIRKALQENPDITIVNSAEKNLLPDAKDGICHKITIVIVPKKKYHSQSEIQAFINSLVPGIKPNDSKWYAEKSGQNSYGRLEFCEDVGTVTTKRTITLTDEDLIASDSFVNGKQEIERTETIKRETLIVLFPNLEIANLALNGVNSEIPYDHPFIVPLTILKRLI